MSFWSDPIGSTVGTVNTIGRDISNVVSGVGQIGQAIINNPLPIIETLAISAVLPEALPGLSAAQIAAIKGAAVSAANGGSVQQIAQSAAAAAVGSYASTGVATSLAGTAPDATTTALANIAGSAAGSAAQTAIMGGNASTILQNALAGAGAAGSAAGASALGAGTTAANVLGGAVGGASQAGGNTLTTLLGAAGGAGKSLAQTTPSTPPSGQTSSIVPPILQNATASLDTETKTDAGSPINVAMGAPYQTTNPPPSNVALPQGYSLANVDTPNAIYINTSNGNNAWIVQTDPNASPIPPASVAIQPNVPPVGTGVNLSTLDQGTAEGLRAILNPGGGSGGQSEASIAFVGSVNGTPIYSANGIQFSLITVNGSPALQDANGTVYPIPDNSSLLPTLSQTQIYQNALANSYNDTVPNIKTSVASTETPVTPTPTQPTPAQSTDTQPVGDAGKGGGGGGGGTSGTAGGSSGGAISQVGQAGVASTSGGQTGATPSTPLPADINLPVSQGQTGIRGTTGVGGVTGITGVGGMIGITNAPATPGVALGPVSPGYGSPGGIGGLGSGGIGGAGGGTGGGVGTGGGTGQGEGEGGGEGGGVGGGKGRGVGSGIGDGSGAGTGLITPYIPDLFIESNVPKKPTYAKLASALKIAPTFLTGQTQGLGGGAGGGVSVESEQPQKAVWNVQSLKLQPGAQETEDKDYGNLSTALGI